MRQRCRRHPTYRGIRKPTADCADCRSVFEKVQLAASYAMSGCYDDADVEEIINGEK